MDQEDAQNQRTGYGSLTGLAFYCAYSLALRGKTVEEMQRTDRSITMSQLHHILVKKNQKYEEKYGYLMYRKGTEQQIKKEKQKINVNKVIDNQQEEKSKKINERKLIKKQRAIEFASEYLRRAREVNTFQELYYTEVLLRQGELRDEDKKNITKNFRRSYCESSQNFASLQKQYITRNVAQLLKILRFIQMGNPKNPLQKNFTLDHPLLEYQAIYGCHYTDTVHKLNSWVCKRCGQYLDKHCQKIEQFFDYDQEKVLEFYEQDLLYWCCVQMLFLAGETHRSRLIQTLKSNQNAESSLTVMALHVLQRYFDRQPLQQSLICMLRDHLTAKDKLNPYLKNFLSLTVVGTIDSEAFSELYQNEKKIYHLLSLKYQQKYLHSEKFQQFKRLYLDEQFFSLNANNNLTEVQKAENFRELCYLGAFDSIIPQLFFKRANQLTPIEEVIVLYHLVKLVNMDQVSKYGSKKWTELLVVSLQKYCQEFRERPSENAIFIIVKSLKLIADQYAFDSHKRKNQLFILILNKNKLVLEELFTDLRILQYLVREFELNEEFIFQLAIETIKNLKNHQFFIQQLLKSSFITQSMVKQGDSVRFTKRGDQRALLRTAQAEAESPHTCHVLWAKQFPQSKMPFFLTLFEIGLVVLNACMVGFISKPNMLKLQDPTQTQEGSTITLNRLTEMVSNLESKIVKNDSFQFIPASRHQRLMDLYGLSDFLLRYLYLQKCVQNRQQKYFNVVLDWLGKFSNKQTHSSLYSKAQTLQKSLEELCSTIGREQNILLGFLSRVMQCWRFFNVSVRKRNKDGIGKELIKICESIVVFVKKSHLGPSQEVKYCEQLLEKIKL